MQHNAQPGGSCWITFRGHVYDASAIRQHALGLVRSREGCGRDEGDARQKMDVLEGCHALADVACNSFEEERPRMELARKNKKGACAFDSSADKKRRFSGHGGSVSSCVKTKSTENGMVYKTEVHINCNIQQSTPPFHSHVGSGRDASNVNTRNVGSTVVNSNSLVKSPCYDSFKLSMSKLDGCEQGHTIARAVSLSGRLRRRTRLIGLRPDISLLRRSDLSQTEIEDEIHPSKIGTICRVPSWKYWDSIRSDVRSLLDDITKNDQENEISEFKQDWIAQLRRWLSKYANIDPSERSLKGDPNTNVFLLQNPEALRKWLKVWEPFDTQLPPNGEAVWACAELGVLPPLGNTHEVFLASLRSHFTQGNDFDFDIHGEAAWDIIPLNVIRDDCVTEKQAAEYNARKKRNDRRSPGTMQRRRHELGTYFMKKYNIPREKIKRFLQWASIMENNQRELDMLCKK